MSKLVYLIYTVLVAFGLSVPGSHSTKRAFSVPDIFRADTVIKDIPVERLPGKRKQLAGYYLSKAGFEKRLGFTSLENGFDSLTIRIWYGYTNAVDSLQLIELKDSGGKWNGRSYLIRVRTDTTDYELLPFDLQSKDVTPHSGWDKFIGALLSKDILTLPDMRNIPTYPGMTGGGYSIIVEIATTNLYRIYSYTDPKYASGTVKQAQKVEDILRLVSDELDFKQLRRI